MASILDTLDPFNLKQQVARLEDVRAGGGRGTNHREAPRPPLPGGGRLVVRADGTGEAEEHEQGGEEAHRCRYWRSLGSLRNDECPANDE